MAKYAGEFLALGVGGRALALGGAHVALVNDVTAGYWNPAALARLEYPQLILMHDEQFGSLVNHDYGAVAIPFGRQASLGLSVLRLGVDDIPDTRNAGIDVNGNLTYDPAEFSRVDPNRVTYFNSADWAFLFSYARSVSEQFAYGANLKLIRRELGDTWCDGQSGSTSDSGTVPGRLSSLAPTCRTSPPRLLAWDTGRNELISPTIKARRGHRR